MKFYTKGFIVSLLLLSVLISCSKKVDNTSLTIYAYDSFVSEWGPGAVVIPLFEEKYGINVNMISSGDAGQVLSRAVLEADRPEADIIVGIDNSMLSQALDAGILSVYKSPNLSNIPDNLKFDSSFHVTPFDYGYFSIIYNTEKILSPPLSLEDLTKPEYSKKLILMDARTSSPGLGFLLWTIAVYGDNYTDYWERLKPSILTITEGWSSAYGLFTSGEAPLVLSYTTSPAYHVEYEDTKQYMASLFQNGNYMQIEGMAILKDAPHREAAEKFIDFILTPDFQKAIPLTNWMFPVLPGIEMPDSFEYALKTEVPLQLNAETIESNRKEWLKQWILIVSK